MKRALLGLLACMFSSVVLSDGTASQTITFSINIPRTVDIAHVSVSDEGNVLECTLKSGQLCPQDVLVDIDGKVNITITDR